ncbi:MAG: UDP-3-O-(3-hydroxymyristoyl)glucosamine N-acyltransferase [Alphaproteobacteria bacterium]|nr:UDP-3-O-(3-hydroxymyristoyl)glucosamine N-acyltransferase [Alphaproteobacteria bacterium]
MADPRFFTKSTDAFTLEGLAVVVKGVASCDIAITDVAPLEYATRGALSFFNQKRYLPVLEKSKASAVLLKEEHKDMCPPDIAYIVCEDPYGAMAQITQLLYPQAALSRPTPGQLQEGHQIHPTAILEDDVEVGIGAIIGPHVEIGRGSVIGAYCVIGHGVTIGRECTIAPHVVIGYALIGDNVILHSGAVIGADGFGFAPAAQHIKIPQIGRVVLQSHVEIGASSTIDRGTFADTIIGEGTKIDNQVQVGHNCIIGRHCFMAGQVGISGSTTMGDYVQMGGQSATSGHVNIGSFTMASARTGITADIPEGSKIAGYPAQPYTEFYKDMAFLKRLRKHAKEKK